MMIVWFHELHILAHLMSFAVWRLDWVFVVNSMEGAVKMYSWNILN